VPLGELGDVAVFPKGEEAAMLGFELGLGPASLLGLAFEIGEGEAGPVTASAHYSPHL
jgi:hypothetical protein